MDKVLDKQVIGLQGSLEKIKTKLKVVSQLLIQERDNVLLDEENFEKSLEKIKHVHYPREQIVSLNVGGTIFCTSYETLVKTPSMLQAMFSGRHELHPKKDGTHFFDRDPQIFKYVLNFLRNGKIIWPEDRRLKKLIQVEFDYFAIDYDPSPEGFEYTGDFDNKGFLYWLATEGGISPWVNPRDKNVVSVESETPRYYRIVNNASERYDNPLDLSLVVDYGSDPQTCITSPSSTSGFIVDLKTWAIKLTTITLSCYYTPTSYLTGMSIRVSNDKSSWVTLALTEGNLNNKTKTYRRTVSDSDPHYRYILVRNNSYQCLLSGMEIYGTVIPLNS